MGLCFLWGGGGFGLVFLGWVLCWGGFWFLWGGGGVEGGCVGGFLFFGWGGGGGGGGWVGFWGVVFGCLVFLGGGVCVGVFCCFFGGGVGVEVGFVGGLVAGGGWGEREDVSFDDFSSSPEQPI